VDVNLLFQGSDATPIPDERIPQLADAAAQLEAMSVVCHLLQILNTPHNVSNAAQDFSISEAYELQLELVRFACLWVWQVLGSPYNLTNAAPIGGDQLLALSGPYPLPDFFVRAIYYQLLQVYGSFDEPNATRLGGDQVRREFAISQIYQLLQACGILPGEYSATQHGGYQILAENVSRIQSPASETVQPTDVQEARASAVADTSVRLHCLYVGCKATFGRPQEGKRHHIDVHTQRRRCPFCLYKWSRANKIRTHIMANHKDKPQVLNEIRVKRGKRIVAFLDTLCDANGHSV